MVTTIPEFLQPVPRLFCACHGCYNQLYGCNNLENNGCFDQVSCFNQKNLVVVVPILVVNQGGFLCASLPMASTEQS